MGFDIVHFNLHKTFTQPHGGGGPGSGPIACSDRIEPYLMVPRVVRDGEALRPRLRAAEVDRPAARLPGQLRDLRPYLRLHLLARRRRPARGERGGGAGRQLPEGPLAERGRAAPGRLRPRLRARVLPLRRADEARAGDRHPRPRQAPARSRLPPADRLLPAAGRGGAAGRADRDRDQGDPRRLRRGDRGDLAEAAEDPEVARTAPHSTPVRRLDEAGAARRPRIRQQLDPTEDP